jgi:hypothetical protein
MKSRVVLDSVMDIDDDKVGSMGFFLSFISPMVKPIPIAIRITMIVVIT